MAINLDKPDRWKDDIAHSVDLYNQWFLKFAPITYRRERKKSTEKVKAMLERTCFLRNLTPSELIDEPEILFSLRMSTAPPIARDRLVGLANVPKSFVNNLELNHRLPPRMKKEEIQSHLEKIVKLILRLADVDIYHWLRGKKTPSKMDVERAASIVADRLCGANADPIVRNAQEKRQLTAIKKWLERRGYKDVTGKTSFGKMNPGTFAFRLNVTALKENREDVNIPIDAVVMPKTSKPHDLPLMIEAKSAGDFTNTNKRRKEEAVKVTQLRRAYGKKVRYILFLCGYFDSGYLGYEAAEGIDWVWEHRIDDLMEFGL